MPPLRGRRHQLSRHIRRIVGGLERIIIIPAQQLRGLHRRRELKGGADRRLGQDLPLHLGGQGQIVFHTHRAPTTLPQPNGMIV